MHNCTKADVRQPVSFFFQAEDGIRDIGVTGVQTCALPIWLPVRQSDTGIAHGCWRACEPHGRPSLRRLQQGLELTRIAVPGQEAVRIVARGQRYGTHTHVEPSEAAGKRLRRFLTAAIRIGIKGQIDGSGAIAQLPKLACVEMVSQRAGNVLEAGLPQCSVVEQALNKDYFRIGPDLLPGVQAAFGTWQETVRRRRCRDAAAVEIAFQWKDDSMHVCVVPAGADQAGLAQSRQRVTQLSQPTPQTTAGRVADSQDRKSTRL